MAVPEVQTAWTAASGAREHLDRALRRAGFDLPPSLVSVTRDGPSKIAPPHLSFADVDRLAAILEERTRG